MFGTKLFGQGWATAYSSLAPLEIINIRSDTCKKYNKNSLTAKSITYDSLICVSKSITSIVGDGK